MNILVIGGGGREHAIAWKARQSPKVTTVFVAPGNAGTALEPGIVNCPLAADNIEALVEFAQQNNIALTLVGPEVPLVAGVVDAFTRVGLKCFGPTAAAAQLEGSKTYCKDFMRRHRIPTADYQTFTKPKAAIDYINSKGAPIVVKADGLAAGKGVVVAHTKQQAIAAVEDMLAGNSFGSAGHRVVIEQFLAGEEASFIVIADGNHAVPMATSQDHKARDNGDQGPNTGGMGAYSPAPVVTPAMHQKIMTEIIQPTLAGMRAEGTPYTGFLYAGLMIGSNGELKVLEYNCRLGDPEAQPIMLRLQSDLIELCLAALNNTLTKTTIDWDQRPALGVVLTAAGYPNQYTKGEIINRLPTHPHPDTKIFHAATTTKNGTLVTSGGRVLCACALGNTLLEAQQHAYKLTDNIHWNGIFYRTDIGFKALKNNT